MLTNIYVEPNTKVSKILFVNHLDFTKMPDKRIIPLFGPNGVGKSTLIRAIQNASGIRIEYENPMQIYSYLNGEDNFRDRKARALNEAFDLFFLKARFDAQSLSEGQSVLYSVYELFKGMNDTENFRTEGATSLFLVDEFDSGLSIDNIDSCMRLTRKALKNRNDIQIIFSFNNPRVLKWFPHVMSMYDGEIHEMHSDEDMLSEIRKNKQLHEKARGRKGRLKVY